MLVLYETAMGYCLFKLTDAAKLDSADLYKEFETPERANKLYVGSFFRVPVDCFETLFPILQD